MALYILSWTTGQYSSIPCLSSCQLRHFPQLFPVFILKLLPWTVPFYLSFPSPLVGLVFLTCKKLMGIANVLPATELYTSKMVKINFMLGIFYHHSENANRKFISSKCLVSVICALTFSYLSKTECQCLPWTKSLIAVPRRTQHWLNNCSHGIAQSWSLAYDTSWYNDFVETKNTRENINCRKEKQKGRISWFVTFHSKEFNHHYIKNNCFIKTQECGKYKLATRFEIN